MVRVADMSAPPGIVEFGAGRRRSDLGTEIGVVGSNDAFDRVEAVVEAAGHLVQLVEQLLVLAGHRGCLLPLGDVVEDHPGEADEQHPDDDDGKKNVFHALSPPCSCAP
ncbi:hypothetical protein SPHINGOAX6_70301 [Sphingomonas sp. AX6]|nr:hypothetical protein SPHINGOAX6_70301 [Sphingomonas sp. AX6]